MAGGKLALGSLAHSQQVSSIESIIGEGGKKTTNLTEELLNREAS